jgi:glycosyltransferase involved in cell wall biosynthesis
VPSPPLISIVTPTYNMGRFLEETIQSVLSQDYPNIEYIVMDAGSTDGTLAILEKYRGRLEFHSGPDRGTADAINKGFARSHGSVFAYLNADDIYLPGAISTAMTALASEPETGVVYGDANWVDEQGRVLAPYPVQPFDAALLSQECFISQPAAFMLREAFELAGRTDPRLQYAYDYDLWIRIARLYPLRKIDAVLATSRMHQNNKTVGQRRAVLRETLKLLESHYGYVPFRPVHAYASYLLDGRDQFFEPLRPSILKYALSLLVGLRYNPGQPFRFTHEWAAVMSLAGLARRWQGFLASFSQRQDR